MISLSVIFSLLFYGLKNIIDKISISHTYALATCLYALSWALRGTISEEMSLGVTFAILVTVTFCTAFFRLGFNKRFFDTAKESTKYKYLFMKSYYTQFFVFVWFAGVASLFAIFGGGGASVSVLYFASSILAFGYAFYKPPTQIRDNT